MSHILMSRELWVMLRIEIHIIHEYIYTFESRDMTSGGYSNLEKSEGYQFFFETSLLKSKNISSCLLRFS